MVICADTAEAKVADVGFSLVSLARVAWEVARFGKNSELEFLR